MRSFEESLKALDDIELPGCRKPTPLSRYVSKNFKLAQRSQIVDQKKEKLFCFKMSLILLQCDLYIKSCDKF